MNQLIYFCGWLFIGIVLLVLIIGILIAVDYALLTYQVRRSTRRAIVYNRTVALNSGIVPGQWIKLKSEGSLFHNHREIVQVIQPIVSGTITDNPKWSCTFYYGPSLDKAHTGILSTVDILTQYIKLSRLQTLILIGQTNNG